MRRNLLLQSLLMGLAIIACGAVARAEVKVASIFSDHAVLQADMPLPVWGWAASDEEVTVTLGEHSKTTKADADGKWCVKLDALKAGQSLSLSVKGTNTVTASDLLVGEVWLCSGQSNMGMTVGGVQDAKEEIARAKHPQIRMYQVIHVTADTPQKDVAGKWIVCAPETVAGFSATAFFFGRSLHQELKAPVGLINSSWGGTPIEAWTSLPVQEKMPELKTYLENSQKSAAAYDPAKAAQRYEQAVAKWKQDAAKAKAAKKQAPRQPGKPVDPQHDPNRPAQLYNAMIVPLEPYAIRGAIWYQGESNAGRGNTYGVQLQAMIANWRADWKEGDFPFLFVQLPNYMKHQTQPVEASGWAMVREGMFKTLEKSPNTGMATTLDIGMDENIHPLNKQEVGRRLALWAERNTYKLKNVGSGPLYCGTKKVDGAIEVSFQTQGCKLKAKGDKLEGFAIAGADKKFVWAEARIEGDRVIVSSPEVKEPVAVRYAWANSPVFSLYNEAGLPASPFRTDDWPN